MNYYIIDALSPLVFRSGKPFGAQSDTDDIMFPLPSAAAGLIRTVSAQQQDGFSGSYDVAALQNIAVNGLFLAKLDDSGSLKQVFVPKPADALYLKNKETDRVQLLRLSPQKVPEDCGSDLPHDLLPVQMASSIKGKPQSGAAFWDLADFLAWQCDGQSLSYEDVQKNSANHLPVEVRSHVAIDRDTLAGEDGKLFQSAAYDFANTRCENHQGWHEERYGFVIAAAESLNDDLVRFGGEGRLSRLEKTEVPKQLFRQPEFQQTNGLKLTLLSPAMFEQGWLPDCLDKDTLTGTLPQTDIRVKLRAAAIDRWQPVSGWDLAKHQPKAMRKAVAAGSVYWLEILENQCLDAKDVAVLNYQSLCQNEQDRLDGFDLCLISAWQLPE